MFFIHLDDVVTSFFNHINFVPLELPKSVTFKKNI